MIIRFSAPSKTFLSGEYAALVGAPALVVCTRPRFELTATRGEGGLKGIPEGSPAWRWLQQRSPLVHDWTLEFIDPHMGQGGLGASSAQFLFVHSFTTFLQSSVSRAVEGLDLSALWNDFHVLTDGQASGADVLAQAVGQVALVEQSQAWAFAWPFHELDFAIVRTQDKVQTHAHLCELRREPLQKLVEPAQMCAQSLTAAGSAEKFLRTIGEFAQALRVLGLQTDHSVRLQDELAQQPWSKGVKGCGALGADTVLSLFSSGDRPAALAYFQQRNLPLVATSTDLEDGLRMSWSWN